MADHTTVPDQVPRTADGRQIWFECAWALALYIASTR